MTCAKCVNSRLMTGEERKHFWGVLPDQVVCRLHGYRTLLCTCEDYRPEPGQGELAL